MTDPRLSRTNDHIFHRLAAAMEYTNTSELTFARIALECSVSRRTLYTHFGSPAEMWREAFVSFYVPMSDAVNASTAAGRVAQGLRHIRDSLETRVTRAAFLTTDETDETRKWILGLWHDELSIVAVPINARTFSRLVGPLCLDALLLRVHTTDAALRELAQFAVREDLAGS